MLQAWSHLKGELQTSSTVCSNWLNWAEHFDRKFKAKDSTVVSSVSHLTSRETSCHFSYVGSFIQGSWPHICNDARCLMEICARKMAYSSGTSRAFFFSFFFNLACICLEVTLNFKCTKMGGEAQAGDSVMLHSVVLHLCIICLLKWR